MINRKGKELLIFLGKVIFVEKIELLKVRKTVSLVKKIINNKNKR